MVAITFQIKEKWLAPHHRFSLFLMILLDETKHFPTKVTQITQISGLTQYYSPADIIITKAIGDVGSLERYPVRARVERNGFILIYIAQLDKVENWFNRRQELTAKLLTYNALQSWIVVTGVIEGNLFGTVGDTPVETTAFNQWLTEARMSGCVVATVSDYNELETLCVTIESVLINNGPVLDVLSIEHLLSTVPHMGPITNSVVNYCGSVWASLAFITNQDLFKTLALNPKAREALGEGYFTRKMHANVREFFGLTSEDYGLGLYIDKD